VLLPFSWQHPVLCCRTNKKSMHPRGSPGWKSLRETMCFPTADHVAAQPDRASSHPAGGCALDYACRGVGVRGRAMGRFRDALRGAWSPAQPGRRRPSSRGLQTVLYDLAVDGTGNRAQPSLFCYPPLDSSQGCASSLVGCQSRCDGRPGSPPIPLRAYAERVTQPVRTLQAGCFGDGGGARRLHGARGATRLPPRRLRGVVAQHRAANVLSFCICCSPVHSMLRMPRFPQCGSC
jgi:hypothetical protein